MSTQITDAFVQQYSANVFHLAQQKGSRLRGLVRNESQVGKSAFYDRIGSAVAQKRSSRHSDTPQIDTPNSRRRVALVDYEYADLIDQQDRIRLLMDPTSEYTMAAMWGLGRAIDDEIIAAAVGTAYSGETGSTSVTLPNAQKVASVSGGAGANLNVQALRRTKKIFDDNDVDEGIPRYFAFQSSELQALLNETEVTSADFNTIRALVMGELNTYMGFQFIRTQRLLTQGSALSFNQSTGVVGSGSGDANTYRRCFAWAQDGVLLAIGKDMQAKIGERADKSYSTQVYACLSVGATRLEEVKVVEVLCNES